MQIQVVDKNDTLIGTKERDEIDYSSDIYRVSALWLTNPSGQALIAKRAVTKKNSPGKWGPAVAGTLESDETYETNIYKEAQEEIGLKGVPFKEIKKVAILEPGNPRHYFCQWYEATVDMPIEAFTRQVSEVDELAWIDVEKLKEEVSQIPEKYLPSMKQVIEDLGL
ncbi:MAG: NUDIX domain-containing protein [Candidatus Microsaccharimonas sp.]